jgi:hypothetical protein
MNIQEFVKIEKPEQFDISEEYAPDAYKKASPYEKYIIYKACTIADTNWAEDFKRGQEFCSKLKGFFEEKEGGRKICDPDSKSELLQEIYQKIWPFMYDEKNQKFWSDTLSSVQYAMGDIFERYIETDEAKEMRRTLGYTRGCSIRYMLDYFSRVGDEDDVIRSVQIAAADIGKIPNVGKFLSAWHTIGNYCPVPKGFNGSRSNYGKHDMWDLSLVKIRQWYLAPNNIAKNKILVKDLFHNRAENVVATTEWLKHSGNGEKGWENFVDTFLFQDWVNTVDVGMPNYYEVLPLGENHNWTNALTPFDDLDNYLENYQNRIFRRGLRMLEKLK